VLASSIVSALHIASVSILLVTSLALGGPRITLSRTSRRSMSLVTSAGKVLHVESVAVQELIT